MKILKISNLYNIIRYNYNIKRNIFLDVIYNDKNKVKNLGCQWDNYKKKWYLTKDINIKLLKNYIKDYLDIKYIEKDNIIKLGGYWDYNRKQWYIKGKENIQNFNKWRIIYLNIKNNEINEAIKLGALLDNNNNKQPYIKYNDINKERFIKWLPRYYLYLPTDPIPQPDSLNNNNNNNNNHNYNDSPVINDEIKSLISNGAQWDNELKKWYIISGLVENEEYFLPYFSQPQSESINNTEHSFYMLFFDTETTGLPDYITNSITDVANSTPSPLINVNSNNINNINNINNDNSNTKINIKTTSTTSTLTSSTSSTTSMNNLQQYPPITDTSRYDNSRVIQLSYLICSYPSMKVILQRNTIFHCEDFEINNSHIHGITNEMTKKQGELFIKKFPEFLSHCLMCRFILAHNIQFDDNILKSELYRRNMLTYLDLFIEQRKLCTLQLTRNYLKLNYGKTANLKNLFECVMNEKIENHHNAVNDVYNLYQVIKRLLEINAIQLPISEENNSV